MDAEKIRARVADALPRTLEPAGVLLRDIWTPGQPLTDAGHQIVDAVTPAVQALLEQRPEPTQPTRARAVVKAQR